MEIAELTCIDFLGIGLEFGKGLVLWGEMLAKHTIFGDEFNPLDVVGLASVVFSFSSCMGLPQHSGVQSPAMTTSTIKPHSLHL